MRLILLREGTFAGEGRAVDSCLEGGFFRRGRPSCLPADMASEDTTLERLLAARFTFGLRVESIDDLYAKNIQTTLTKEYSFNIFIFIYNFIFIFFFKHMYNFF
jgi:hypothetical protein